MKRVYQGCFPLEVAGVTRKLPIVSLEEGLAIASFVLLGDVKLTNACANALAERLKPFHPEVLVTVEAKGIPLTHEVAANLDMQRFVLIRKERKLYMEDVLRAKDRSITTAGEQSLFLDKNDAELLEGKRVAFIDDVISTGGSRRSARHLIEQAGGRIVCEAYVLKEGDWIEDSPNVLYLNTLPLFEPVTQEKWRIKE